MIFCKLNRILQIEGHFETFNITHMLSEVEDCRQPTANIFFPRQINADFNSLTPKTVTVHLNSCALLQSSDRSLSSTPFLVSMSYLQNEIYLLRMFPNNTVIYIHPQKKLQLRLYPFLENCISKHLLHVHSNYRFPFACL